MKDQTRAKHAKAQRWIMKKWPRCPTTTLSTKPEHARWFRSCVKATYNRHVRAAVFRMILLSSQRAAR